MKKVYKLVRFEKFVLNDEIYWDCYCKKTPVQRIGWWGMVDGVLWTQEEDGHPTPEELEEIVAFGKQLETK